MSSDQLSNTFSALADPTRRAILAKLTTGEKTVSDLAEPFDMTMPAITKHLKVLEKAHLIERSKQAQYRPCKLHPEPLKDIDEWMEQYRQFFEASFDRLDDYLQQLQSKSEDINGNE
ncbi:ArsR/SmtB family transcription factor [Fodinibius salsisoli]|uniref:Helix-turn-helix transcriptional regulator n=1 Tax=Fodinibius salsisoli TaxID=2820877 RepID=A0ABT3PIC6_9BACT|nr:metalloregulator ArsR/SmtB family transcription factor [Fodinibius salsisoli]MCW9705538.1 helix-turn-helix transcriptional regulator [Fodinibius salsisoli]